ncbi:putative uncharacterized protein [Clostridium sp. CAG:575]|nr:putative uncharacterized protein [Clostridium sp. CAG:575]
MRKIGFIGAYDKTDMLLNIAKILTTMSKKVLIIDSTINQKAKYVVPTINPTISYVTFFEDIDVAVGFNTLEDIERYLGARETLPYDIVLIDADTEERIRQFNLFDADKNYFVTSFDMYSLKKGLEILGNLQDTLELTKVYFTEQALKEDDDYLNYLASGYKIIWNNEIVYFPIENGDATVIAENQRVQKIKFKRLSVSYKDALTFMTQQILKENTDSSVRRAIKTIERGV